MWVAISSCTIQEPQVDRLSEFNNAVGKAYAHYRQATFYLGTRNAGIAALELTQMQILWRGITVRFAADPPEAFRNDSSWQETLVLIEEVIDHAIASATLGDVNGATAAIQPIRGILSQLRERNGVTVFSDCINEMNAAMDHLYYYRKNPPELADATVMGDFMKRLDDTSSVYARCYALAPVRLRSNEAFSRFMDSAGQAFRRIDDAILNNDQITLINILRELRSTDRMLFLQFG